MMNVFSVLLALLLSTSVMAKDILVSTVTSDVDSYTTKLWIVPNEDGTAQSLKMTTNDGSNPALFGPSKVKTGMVLKKVDSYDVVVLKSEDFEIDRGGHLEMEYLSNGITGSRDQKELTIEFDGATWKLYHRGEAVSRFHFTGKRILGKLVGIKRVDIR
tara:strand:- start:15029 stop:15505 length:477 start_codon:yes stop_codon:yes gene_type:complete